MPFGLWHALASVAEMLPERPITRNQVELMQLNKLGIPFIAPLSGSCWNPVA